MTDKGTDGRAIAAELLAYGEVMTQNGKLIQRHTWRVDYVPPRTQDTKSGACDHQRATETESGRRSGSKT